MAFFKEELKSVKAFIFDVDGVIATQEMSLSPEGELVRTSCAKDGYAIMYAIKKNYIVAIISGGGTPSIRERLMKLGIKEIHLKVENKVEAFNEIVAKYNLKPEEILYMGDDIPDYNVMRMVGVPVCPSDACEEIKEISKYVSDVRGGHGCVRDVMSQVMRARGDWMDTKCYVKSM
ncbi:MAG: HAD hydrolase family protein [Culturomica sp.]|jgi:3-deoxy-D-manno-octulosonate 8-phosphate phosphatase (KDO 8-P phosphatase)|nr:HAD hydrolase family protein [Culturomica sp.]